MNKTEIYIRSQSVPSSTAIFTPLDIKDLVSNNIVVKIESSHSKLFTDEQYLNAGAFISSKDEWTSARKEVYILGEEIINLGDEFPLIHTHICNIPDSVITNKSNSLWRRLILGNGQLINIKILTNKKIDSKLEETPPPLPSQINNNDSKTLKQFFLLDSPEEFPAWREAKNIFEEIILTYKENKQKEWNELSLNKRSEVRVNFKTSVTVTMSNNESFECQSRDISMSGIFLGTDHKMNQNDQCNIQIEWIYGEKTIFINTTCEVLRCVPDGFALYFNNMDMDSFDILKEIIKYSYHK